MTRAGTQHRFAAARLWPLALLCAVPSGQALAVDPTQRPDAVAAGEGGAFEWITANEIADWQQALEHGRRSAGPSPACSAAGDRDAADHPTIEMVSPPEASAPAGPVVVEIRFGAAEGARVDPATFKVCYFLKAPFNREIPIDVTGKLVKHASVSESGLVSSPATVPAGSYHFRLFLADDRQRIGSKDIHFVAVK